MRIFGARRLQVIRRQLYTRTFTTLGSTELHELVSQTINNIDLTKIPKSKEEALRHFTRHYLEHRSPIEIGSSENARITNQHGSFMDIFEKDDTVLLSKAVEHVKETHIFKKDHQIRERRQKIPREGAPLKHYAVFLKYIYENEPDIDLIKRYYLALPAPRPLHVHATHFERFMEQLLTSKDAEFYLQVVSDLKDSQMEMTLQERCKLISNVFKVGSSSPLAIYNFLRSKIAFNDIALYNAVLRNCIKDPAEDDSAFYSVLRDLSSSNVVPNGETYVSMLKHFSKTNSKRFTKAVQQLFNSNSRIPFDILLINSLIQGFFKSQQPEVAYKLLEWLLQMTSLKKNIDTNSKSREFLRLNADLFQFFNENSGQPVPLAYLPNFDEETGHICLVHCLRRAQTEKTLAGVLNVLNTMDRYNLIPWEASYKALFRGIYDLETDCYSLHELQRITAHLLSSDTHRLSYMLSNLKFRELILDNYIKKCPSAEVVQKLHDKKAYMSELFEAFYKKYNRGFKSSHKTGSSKLHEVIMEEIVNEFRKLTEE